MSARGITKLPGSHARSTRSARALRSSARAACLFVIGAGALTLPSAGPCGAQGLLPEVVFLPNFGRGAGQPRVGVYSLGRKAADAVRARVERLVNRRDVTVFSGFDMREQFYQMAWHDDTLVTVADANALAHMFRADEIVDADIGRTTAGFQITGTIVLARNNQLRQPLPSVTGPTIEKAADEFAAVIIAARRQMPHERRCEAGLREGRNEDAASAARIGVEAYPGAEIARICLIWARSRLGAPASETEQLAAEVLKIDPNSFPGIEAAAIADDAFGRRDEAAKRWLRLVTMAPDSLPLVERVAGMLLAHGNAAYALPLITPAAAANPDRISLLRFRWEAETVLARWHDAVRTGEQIVDRDRASESDSAFAYQLAVAYDADGQRIQAIEHAARAVTRFPGDSRIYSLYATFVNKEAGVAVNRGLDLFPNASTLLVLQAQQLRAAGNVKQSADAYRQALTVDPTLSHGFLTLAQTLYELGQRDSVRAALRAAVNSGEDSALVARFALAKGNDLYRSGAAAGSRDTIQAALSYMLFADSLKATAESSLLISAAAMTIAQRDLLDASKEPGKERRCELARTAGTMLEAAQAHLAGIGETPTETSKQLFAAASTLVAYHSRLVTASCS